MPREDINMYVGTLLGQIVKESLEGEKLWGETLYQLQQD